MTGICFIISAVGGPRILSQILSEKLDSNFAYVISQKLPANEFLQVLIDCLREDCPYPIHYVEKEIRLESGQIYFLPWDKPFVVKDNLKLSPYSSTAPKKLDLLLESSVQKQIPSTVIVLSGMFDNDDGIEGLKALKASGTRIIGTEPRSVAVAGMVEKLQQLGIIEESYPPERLLDHAKVPSKQGESERMSKFLVVDDEKDVRTAIKALLESEEIDCDEAVDGLDALRMIQKNRYSAAFLDIQMPEMDGIKTLDALKTIDPGLPILVITGNSDPDILQKIQDYKIAGVLLKPFTLAELRVYLPSLKAARKY